MSWDVEMSILNRNEVVLVFVDVQGRLAEVMHDKEGLDRNLERMIRCAQLLNIPMIVTEQIPEKLGATNEPFQSLLQGALWIDKTSFSCWGEPTFVEAFQVLGKKQVLLVGIETHVCIYQTALDLMAEGLDVFVAADAVSSRSLENKQLALETLRQEGTQVLPTETLLFALLRDAKDPAFKEVLKLIK